MNRYVLTEEGEIFDTTVKDAAYSGHINVRCIIDKNYLICYSTYNRRYICNHGRIVQQSDSLKDLFDCIIRISVKAKWNPIILSDENDKTLIDNDHIDYGAIWTSDERGRTILKIVAKKAGEEWELIPYEIY